jgi:hypothetical protein
MTDKEIGVYKQIRAVDGAKFLAASKLAMSNTAKQKFDVENAARTAAIARVKPVHQAMRDVIGQSHDFLKVREALATARKPQTRAVLGKPYIPPAPKVRRLKLGSVHLVDVPPFQALTWHAEQVYNGAPGSIQQLTADATTGDMTFDIWGGFSPTQQSSSNSSASCWCAVGQAYTMPADLRKDETGGASLRFTATPSFNWNAGWVSGWWRLASGDIWIGQVVNRYVVNSDGSLSYVDDPVNYQISLRSWSDQNLADDGNPSGSNTAYGLTTSAFVEPGHVYGAWVWIGATVYGDNVDSGNSQSHAAMTANVSQLVLDTF